MSLLFNMLSRLVITFLPRSKHLLILWLKSPSPVILEPRKINSATVSTVSPSICYEVVGPGAMILVFWMLNFKPTFPLSSFTFIKRIFSSYSLSAIRVVSSAYLRLLIFLPTMLIPYSLDVIPFPIWNQSVVPCPVLTVPGLFLASSNCFLACVQVSQEADQVVWYSHLFQNFPQWIRAN